MIVYKYRVTKELKTPFLKKYLRFLRLTKKVEVFHFMCDVYFPKETFLLLQFPSGNVTVKIIGIEPIEEESVHPVVISQKELETYLEQSIN